MTRPPILGVDRAAPLPAGQLELPLLTDDQAATIDHARAVVERARAQAVINERPTEAAELERLGDQLLDVLNAHAAAAGHPPYGPRR